MGGDAAQRASDADPHVGNGHGVAPVRVAKDRAGAERLVDLTSSRHVQQLTP
jgi:hypothetical protein